MALDPRVQDESSLYALLKRFEFHEFTAERFVALFHSESIVAAWMMKCINGQLAFDQCLFGLAITLAEKNRELMELLISKAQNEPSVYHIHGVPPVQ